MAYQLSDKQIQVARLLAEGRSHREISRIIGVPRSTVSRWARRPEVQDTVRRMCEQAITEQMRQYRRMLEKMYEVGDMSIRAIADALHSADPNDRWRIALGALRALGLQPLPIWRASSGQQDAQSETDIGEEFRRRLVEALTASYCDADGEVKSGYQILAESLIRHAAQGRGEALRLAIELLCPTPVATTNQSSNDTLRQLIEALAQSPVDEVSSQ